MQCTDITQYYIIIYTKWRYAIHNNKLTLFSAAFRFKVENFSGRIKSFQSTFQRHSCGNQPTAPRHWTDLKMNIKFVFLMFSLLSSLSGDNITLNNSKFLNVLLFLWSRIDMTFVYSIATYNLVIMRPSSLGGGRILRRTLSVRLSVRPSRASRYGASLGAT